MNAHLFFVDDDPKAGALFSRFCRTSGFQVSTFQSPKDALAAFAQQPCDLMITDLKMPGMSGIELLGRVRELNPDIPVIIITGYSTVDHAVEALRLGASDFIKKPYDAEALLHQVKRVLEHYQLKQENQRLRRSLAAQGKESPLLGETAVMHELRRMIRKLAAVRCNVIITGESGTGKELVARDLHELSPFSDQPFVVIDCGALTDSLLESELFGHEKGAFTGADRQRVGRLEAAKGGTVFLDEISNISDAMQTKLLRVVQEQQIVRVGGVQPIEIDVRFIVATNRDLEAQVKAGEFRHDLYHRLNVVQLKVPALRQRRDDIPLLIQHFLMLFLRKYERGELAFGADTLRQLMRYDWPGNVRELRNLVERQIALADHNQRILDAPLPDEVKKAVLPAMVEGTPTLKVLEQRYIEQVLADNQGNRERTAEVLGINKSTLWRKLQQYENS